MKNKSKILKKIDDAIIHEEMAIPVYTEHLRTAMFWSGKSEQTRTKVTEKLKLLSRESKMHITLLKRVRKILSKL